MANKALGIVAGLATWVIVVTLAGVIMRTAWPAYTAVADAMAFTLPMMLARLTVGAVATLMAGWVVAAITRGSVIAAFLTGLVLLLAFVPEHITIWEKFPVWYHLTFLLSLVPLTCFGGRLPAITRAHSSPSVA
jgi:hypothetical protein